MDAGQARQYITRLDAAAMHRSVPIADGRSMRWRIFGHGDPLVLIHGGHGSWLHWIRNIEALANHHSVLVPDLPGYGESDDLPHGSGLQEIVAAVITCLDSLLPGRPAIDIAGFSFGGGVSAHLAVQRGAVRRLALVGSVGHGTPQRPRARLQRWRNAEGVTQEAALHHNLVAHMLHDEKSADALAFQAYSDAIRATRFHSRGTVRSMKLAELLAPFARPVLLVWGEHDVTATPGQAIRTLTSGKPHWQYSLIPDGGHWIQYEQADAVNAKLMQWFGGNAGSADTPSRS